MNDNLDKQIFINSVKSAKKGLFLVPFSINNEQLVTEMMRLIKPDLQHFEIAAFTRLLDDGEYLPMVGELRDKEDVGLAYAAAKDKPVVACFLSTATDRKQFLSEFEYRFGAVDLDLLCGTYCPPKAANQ